MYRNVWTISHAFFPIFDSAAHIMVRLIYGFLQLTATRKISIRSLNQYSELRCFFSTYVTLPERGRQTISVSDTKQRSERGGGRKDILFPFTL